MGHILWNDNGYNSYLKIDILHAGKSIRKYAQLKTMNILIAYRHRHNQKGSQKATPTTEKSYFKPFIDQIVANL